MSMVIMINEKFRENVLAWEGFAGFSELLPIFFQRLYTLNLEGLRMHEKIAFLLFLIHAFQSLENDTISKQILRLVQLPLWSSLSPGRLQVRTLYKIPLPSL